MRKGDEDRMNVKVYSTPTCPYCSMAKRYLDSRHVGYEEVDVSADSSAAAELVGKSGQRGVPVIEIDGNIVVGFDKDRIDSYL
jgi:glutaredoxin-like YruB-family protein